MRHRDFEVFIECNGRVLEEYATEIDGTVISCYVISDAGKVFDIRCTNHSSADMAISGAVDGREFPRRTLFRADGVAGGIVCRDGVNGHRQFLFSDVEVTDDEDAEHIMSDISNVGLMQLNVFRCRVCGVKPYELPTGLMTTNLGLLPEKAKKEGTHCVSFGQVKGPPPKWMPIGTYIDAASSPYITFNIRHLPSAILQARGIAAPLGSGSPSTQPTCAVSNKREDPTAADSHGRDASPERGGRGDRAAIERPLKRPRRAETVSMAGAPSSGRSATTEALQVVDTKPLLKGEGGGEGDDVGALRAQLRVLQDKLNHIENGRKQAGRSLSLKREPSPITVGRFNGFVIDLTND